MINFFKVGESVGSFERGRATIVWGGMSVEGIHRPFREELGGRAVCKVGESVWWRREETILHGCDLEEISDGVKCR